MLKDKVEKTIKENNLIQGNQHIVLGLSGGPDSLCLFFVLMDIAKGMNLTIHAVHINHKFRPGAAEEDQDYVEKICAQNGVQCTTFVFDCNKIAIDEKITSEEAGRQVRYSSFAKVAQDLVDNGIKRSNIKIAVAQNADDQSETILFRILRGTGIDGLKGISYMRNDEQGNTIIRPLLDVCRKEIEEFCEENNLNPRIDKTNLEPLYTRNKIRLNLIPYLQREYNENIKETIARLGKISCIDSDYFFHETEKIYETAIIEKESNRILLNGDILKNVHKAIRHRVMSMALNDIGLYENITYLHFEGCNDIIENDKPSASMSLPKGYIVEKIYKNIQVRCGEEIQKDIDITIRQMPILEFDIKKTDFGNCAVFDLDKLKKIYGEDVKNLIKLRNRREEDLFFLNQENSKKIKSFFIDEKVPKIYREELKMVAIGKEILWILPSKHFPRKPLSEKGRFSGRYKLCNTTKNTIIIEIFCKI